MQPDKPFCGIDFGTSNSTCAIAFNGTIKLAPLEGESLTMPSAIFFRDDGTPVFGRQAISAYLDGEEGRLMRGLKSVLGTSLMSEKTMIKNRAKNFTDILAVYIGHLKEKAEAFTGEAIESAVFGRPVHFHDDDVDADQRSQDTLAEIASSVGFKHVIFQYEPIAAGFAHEKDVKSEQLSLVIDLGGGTSDFTVIRMSAERFGRSDREKDILSTTGIRVGGTNFDQRLSMKAYMPHLGSESSYRSDFDASKILQVPRSPFSELSDWARVNFAQTAQAIRETKKILRQAIEPEKLERLLHVQEAKLGHAILQEVEQAKIRLTSEAETYSEFHRLGLPFGVDVSAQNFEGMIYELIDRIKTSIDECINIAGVSYTDISLIVLTGGSSELPVINRLVKSLFSRAQISSENKLGSVGLGLAYNAHFAFGT